MTPDAETGLGRWSADAFARAMHDGIGRDGTRLYPAFPYPFYTRVAREDVDAIYRTALSLNAKIVRAPQENHWAPGYYSVLFEDPDGIRLEANFVPGKGHLGDKTA